MKNKNVLFEFSFHIVSLVLGIIFILSIANTKNSNISYDYLNEEVSNVSSFITDSKTFKNEDLEDFIEDLYEERNNSIETGNVEKLYSYYDITTKFGANSLDREFKRIAYFRDWSLEKKATLTDIDSDIVIDSITTKDDIIHVNLKEKFSFKFHYNKTPKKTHEFSHVMIHNLQIKELDNGSFIVLSEYYDDFLNDSLDKYRFDLTEKNLVPITKESLNLLIK